MQRRVKVKHSKGCMDMTRAYLDKAWHVAEDELPFEFFMNRLRLLEPCPKADYPRFTGLELSAELRANLATAVHKGLITETPTHWQLTELGKRYLNNLLETLV